MSTASIEEIKKQLAELELETKTLNGMTGSLDDLQEQVEHNNTARARLKRKLLETGYRI